VPQPVTLLEGEGHAEPDLVVEELAERETTCEDDELELCSIVAEADGGPDRDTEATKLKVEDTEELREKERDGDSVVQEEELRHTVLVRLRS
jgi:hypothetical protein